MKHKIKVGSDFSGVGAFNQALIKLGFEYEEVFACDMDKFARQTFIQNYGEPGYFPENVYERNIPEESLDFYMTSPPCQAFSLAGKRKGKNDDRGILFFNSLEFIEKNKPRFFCFENVKGLLSDDNGNTFQEWINYLGGKSINGLPVLFPYEDSVPYHIYWKVLNAKDFGVPQNRERVFIIGIRDNQDNVFQWPREIPLERKLKDVLEENVPEKYFLSEKMVSQLLTNGIESNKNQIKIIGNTHPSKNGMNGNVFDENGIAPTLSTNKGEGIKIKSATKKGYEIATENDSINFSVPNSETRRGRVGKEVAQTLDTYCNQAVISNTRNEKGQVTKRNLKQEFNTIHTQTGGVGDTDQFVLNKYRIRRLTPRECFRLMGFPDSFTWPVSDSQAYKQAGNSIVVDVLADIINQLKKL